MSAPDMSHAAALLADLLRCPSVTPAEAGALAYVEKVLSGAGFRVERVTFTEPGTPDVENLFATIGTGEPHLAFAGHTDVVPPGDESRWHHPPFAGAVANGELWGRGAVDMKGAIACFMAAALEHVAAGPPVGRISFLLTGDEEGPSVNGTAKLLAWAAEKGERFDACIVGEPTNPQAIGDAIKIGRRGSLSGTIIVTGKQGHVAYPHLADNPVPALMRLVSAITADRLDNGSADFEPSNLEVTALKTDTVAFNVIPAEAQARFNIRFNDHWNFASLQDWLHERLDRAADGRPYAIAYEPMTSDVFLTRSDALIGTLSEAIRTVTGREPGLSTGGGTSDARFIKNYCPVVEFGLVGQTMHQIDERVPLTDLATLTAIYRRFLDRFFGQGR